ncbi:MAG: hypothetical protein H0T14_06985 [Nocardioidaceae bacterium]|nr:hypothetical protein [Nocardioidaceae bacterium]
MTPSRSRRTRGGTVAELAALCLLLAACREADKPDGTVEPAPTPSSDEGQCGKLTLAYDPGKGYEPSAFVVGGIAEAELGCEVVYRKTTSRQAWRLVARGKADAYLDAYGNEDLREKVTGPKGSVTVVGPNGIHGGVRLVVPTFMYDLGLRTFRDLGDTTRIGWGSTPPVLTTLPELRALAEAAVEFSELDYEVRDYRTIQPTATMGDLLTATSFDDSHKLPNVYAIEGPRSLLASRPGREIIEIPESAASGCVPDRHTTLCSSADFTYEKIVSKELSTSSSPAYNLIYNYRLGRKSAGDILQLVDLSGYRFNAADASSWINTHEEIWRLWLQ